jgi:hypothetical protein
MAVENDRREDVIIIAAVTVEVLDKPMVDVMWVARAEKCVEWREAKRALHEQQPQQPHYRRTNAA